MRSLEEDEFVKALDMQVENVALFYMEELGRISKGLRAMHGEFEVTFDALKVKEEVQDLIEFVGINLTGLRKILKKVRRRGRDSPFPYRRTHHFTAVRQGSERSDAGRRHLADLHLSGRRRGELVTHERPDYEVPSEEAQGGGRVRNRPRPWCR